MFALKHKKILFAISGLLVAFSLFSIFFFGLNLGIEFTGGAIIEITYPEGRPEKGVIENELGKLALGDTLVQPSGDDGYIIRTKELSPEERQELLGVLSFSGEKVMNEERYSLVGPSIGVELKKKAWLAMGFVTLAIIFYIAFAFRKVSGAVLANMEETRLRSWHFGIFAIVALAHDIIIPTGIFAFLGTLFVDAQIDVLFVTALLAILGYSVNDTIVVFDRVRENLLLNHEEKQGKTFEEIVGKSLRQSYGRSINTSLTTLFVLLALFFIGGSATENFALVLAIGVVAGTWSSLFLATPLLVTFGRKKKTG